MDGNTVSSILQNLRESSSSAPSGQVFVSLGGSKVPLRREGFCSIAPDVSGGSVVAFVDGGSADLFSSPSFCVGFVRVYHAKYQGNLRLASGFDEFYASVSIKDGRSSARYCVSLYPARKSLLTDGFFGSKFEFDCSDPLLGSDSSSIISAIPGIVRRLAELSCASALVADLGRSLGGNCDCSAVVLDGDFSFRTSFEESLLASLKESSLSSGVVVCGLSKTSSLSASNGFPVAFVLGGMDFPGCWHYGLGGSPCLSFLKLHPRSGYVFRMDSFVPPSSFGWLLSLLVRNSVDPVFLGYPYGLVAADRFARVPNQEADRLKTLFFSRAGKDAELLRRLSRSSDAHSVLDNIC